MRLSAITAWQEHTPFAMYLVDLLRPRRLVERGTRYGDSYCAFWQPVSELERRVAELEARVGVLHGSRLLRLVRRLRPGPR